MYLWSLLAVWAGLVAMSGFEAMQPPTGDSFTRGMNRISGFLQYQGLALVIALVALVLRKHARGFLLRRVMLVPISVTVLLLLLIVGMVGYALLFPA